MFSSFLFISLFSSLYFNITQLLFFSIRSTILSPFVPFLPLSPFPSPFFPFFPFFPLFSPLPPIQPSSSFHSVAIEDLRCVVSFSGSEIGPLKSSLSNLPLIELNQSRGFVCKSIDFIPRLLSASVKSL